MISVPEENQFIKQFVDSLSSRGVRYGKDYMPRSLHTTPKITVSSLNTRTTSSKTDVSNDKLELAVKVLKPASQFTIGNISADDTVLVLKKRIYQQQSAFPVNRQRLLLKGKVLSDQKALSDYGIASGAVIHLMATAAPKSTAKVEEEVKTVGRFGLSLEGEKTIDSAEFWDAIHRTIKEKMHEDDAQIVMNKLKHAL
ncbi:ubiquitin family-domain-containing protein [Radiomyces spectabilis]|uniref:ubiquitin family-domain-containing protein n=1 Tax=Radiomyces spectabilis TaxID=64574 RepID=UPI00221F8F75|nr:ubiquitin family-domain-containing protein [Radiomyces spectabilis]KAI8377984.1 ubiquitin family-domain-containing protein [Radiomyces spectabilis]